MSLGVSRYRLTRRNAEHLLRVSLRGEHRSSRGRAGALLHQQLPITSCAFAAPHGSRGSAEHSMIGDKLEPHRSSFAKKPMASSTMSRSALRIVGPLSHARLWISNGHPASVVIKNQHLTIEKRSLSAAR
jgi:hypothetical protein